MQLKQVNNGGLMAWSQSQINSQLFVTGTSQQNESNLYILQIFTLEISDSSSSTPKLLGKTRSEFAYSSLVWNNFGENTQYPFGVIVAGLVDGSVLIFDPNCIIPTCYLILLQADFNNNSNELQDSELEFNIGCLCYEQNLFEGPVVSIESNPFKPNLISAGGAQEVLIMNIEGNIAEPQIFSPGTPNLHEGSQISSVSWNQKVQHILASSSTNGLTVVWDLKTNKAIFNFQDGTISYDRQVSLSWNPEIPTQIAVAYDDPNNSELQIWDLRNPQGPVIQFDQGHMSGITALDWSTLDPTLLVTTGHDQQIICWNYKSGNKVAQFAHTEDISGFKWCPKIQSLFAIVDQPSNNVTIMNFNDSSQQYAPKWLNRSIGARFAPNGRLAVFGQQGMSEYNIDSERNQVIEKLDAMENQFQSSVDCQAICSEKMKQNPNDKQWTYLNALAQGNDEIIKVLGFDVDETIKTAEDLSGKSHRVKEEKVENKKNNQNANPNKKFNFTTISDNDAEGFFDQLSSIQQKTETETTQPKQQTNQVKGNAKVEKDKLITESVSRNINWDTGIEEVIKKNILVGNYNGAIDCALKCGRTSEAFLLAYSYRDVQPGLFEEVTQNFFLASQDQFIKNVFKNMIEKNNKEIASSYSLDSWQEIASLTLCDKSSQTSFEDIMELFAERYLNEKQDEENAILCYILSKNQQKITEIFFNSLQKLNANSEERKLALIEYVEKLIVLQNIIGDFYSDKLYDNLLYEFAQVASVYNKPIVAYTNLMRGDEKSVQIQVLKDLIYHTNETLLSQLYSKPTFPFKSENINAPQKKTQRMPNNNPQPNMRPTGPVRETKPVFPTNQSQNKPQMPTPTRNSGPTQQTFTSNSKTNAPQIFNPNVNMNKSTTDAPPQTTQKNFAQPKQVIPPPKQSNLPKNLYSDPMKQKQSQQFQNQQQNQDDLPPPKQVKQPQQVQQKDQLLEQQDLPQMNTMNKQPMGQPVRTNPQVPFKPVQQKQPMQHTDNFSQNSQDQPPVRQMPPQNVQNNPPVRQQQQPPMRNVQPPPRNQQVPVQQFNQAPMKEMNQAPPQQQQQQVQQREFDFNSLNKESQQVIGTVQKLSQLIDNIENNPKRRSELRQSMQQMYEFVAFNELKPNTLKNLQQICQSVEQNRFQEALQFHATIAKEDWNQNKEWLKSMKRLLMKK